MNILAISIGPITSGGIFGGATMMLKTLATGLAERGHHVRILTAERPGAAPFSSASRVWVAPILPFRAKFPAPYAVAPDQHLALIRRVSEHADWADVIYIHDAGYLYTFAAAGKPLIVSIRELMYPESLNGAFLFNRDLLVANSQYTANCLIATAGRVRSGLSERLAVIPNGVEIKTGLGRRPRGIASGKKKDPIVFLYPHRPDRRKGLELCYEVVRRLKRQNPTSRYCLRVPLYRPEDPYARVNVPADLRGNISVHPWIKHDLMGAYYHSGDVTLGLGTFVEGFGPNALLESLTCGVPVVQSAIGPVRDLPHHPLLRRIKPESVEDAVAAIGELLRSRKNTVSPHPRWLRGLTVERMIDRYEQVFKNARVSPPLTANSAIQDGGTYRIAPWCGKFGRTLYHDFRRLWCDAEISRRLLRCGEEFKLTKLLREGITENQMRELIDKAFILPSWRRPESYSP